MTRFMLDTNAVRYFINGEPRLVERIARHLPSVFYLSAVVEAEMRFGVARHPEAKKLRERVYAALATFTILPWTSSVAATYARLRADLEKRGRPLAPLDMMIAAHAVEQDAVLVTSDRALLGASGLICEDWLAR
jgi:tRNA(fMet)-specific endonuclease VapC